MKFTKTKALTSRLLVALALAAVSIAGLSGIAEAATCTTCHAPVGSLTDMRPAESTWRNITTGTIKGSHAKHIPFQTTNKNDCTSCHGAGVTAYTNNHTNNATDFAPAVGYSKGNSVPQSGNPVLGSCTTASCHASAYGTSSVVTPTWGVSSTCIGCHAGAGAFTGAGSVPTTGSHTKHQASGALCAQCHAGATAGVTGGTGHNDNNIDVIGGYPFNIIKHSAGSGYSRCSTASCHANPYSTGSVVSPTWGVSTVCGECHTGAGAFSGAGTSPTTGSHTKHQAGGALCAQCHAGATAAVSGGVGHSDGNIDVIGGYPLNIIKHSIGSGYSRCSTATCHADPYGTGTVPSPTWGLAGGCVSCHTGTGAFTGSGTSPTTGSHTKHQANGALCAQCHAGATAGITGGTGHSDGHVDVIGGYTANVIKHVAGSGYSRCSTASCHADPFSTGSVPTPTWGVSTLCGECHTGAGAFSGAGTSPTTGSHTKHQANGALCAQCHAGATAGVTGGTAHIDGNIDVIAGYTPNVTKHATGSGYKTCNAASCHANVYGATMPITPTWGSASAVCAACHNGSGAFSGAGTSPTTGSHTKHQANGALCAQCHTGATAGVTGGSAHADGNIDVVAGYAPNVTKHLAGSGYGTCNAASCHANVYGSTMPITPTWGSVSAACAACHNGAGLFSGAGSSPTTGSHTKHQAGGALCAQCHTGATAGVTGGTAHTDGNIDVIGGYAPNVTKHSVGSGYSRCSTATCHADPYGTGAVPSPTWGLAGGCVSCHTGTGAFTGSGTSPTTGSHTKHQANGALCAQCHTGATAGVTGGTGHSDGNIDVIGGYAPNVTKHAAGSGYSRCSTASCHADPFSTGSVPTPTWGVSTLCGECHTGAGAFSGAGTSPTTGSHSKHQASGALCAQCHTGVTAGLTGGTAHIDGNIDVIAGYTPNVTKHVTGTGYKTCSAASCHANVYGSTMPITPTWGSASAVCAACHNGSGAFSGAGTSPTTGSHTKHQANGALCAQCHTGATAGVTGGTAHADGNIDVIAGYTPNVTKHTAGSGYKTCNAASCHANPFGTSMPITPTWGNVSAACAACHNGAGLFSGAGSSPVTGSHTKHQAVGALCAQCHTGATAGVTGGTAHADGDIDVIGGYTNNVVKHTTGSGYSRCSTATCHADPFGTGTVVSPTWGLAGGCVSCHNGAGAFTGTGSSPTTGSHSKHQASSALCAQCHAGATAGVTGGAAHIDGNIDVIAGYTPNVTKHATGTGYRTCNAASCHANVYGTSLPVTPTWGATVTVCGACHNGIGAFTGAGTSPATGRHTIHFAVNIAKTATCASCHTGALAGVTGGSAATHMDGNIDVIGGYTVNVTKHPAGTYTGTCNVSCHGSALASNTTTGYPGTPTGNLTLPAWNTPFLTGLPSSVGNGATTWGWGDCAKCHGYPPMTTTHAGYGATDCITCHSHVSASGTSFTDATLHVDGTVQATGDCTGCHAKVQGTRVNVMQQFSTASNSHHYQGSAKINNIACYACHWESDSLGKATTYHRAGGSANDSVVDLVIWNATTRPTGYTANVTASTYQSGGAAASSRAELTKINNHCLGCHNAANMNITPFATDTNTPSTYSWEKKPTTAGGFGTAQSIGAKYLSTTTTAWGKFTGNFTNNKNQTKAYSAHNNSANQRGWSTLAENLQSTTAVANYPNTSGTVAVLCFDCHNSHGSAKQSPTAITSSYDSATGVKNGAILKQTIAGKGGYTNTYMPGAAGSTADKNSHNSGAGLCFDCHNNASANTATLSGSTTPWGYTATYGATQAIFGYNDTPYFGKSGGTFAKTLTYTYTAGTAGAKNKNMGGHFGASATLINTPDAAHQIGGLCTPCHDPHGVSPGISTPANAVPLLKGTYVTSPYKVDVAGPAITRGGGSKVTAFTAGTQTGYVAGYHIDQNTMQTSRNMKPTTLQSSWLFATSAKTLQTLNSTQFAGLCSNCHTQATLNSTANAASTNWKTSGRIHNSVAGWASAAGGNTGNTKHAFTCSKCHTTHNSRLPRLLVTNCLDVKHAGRAISIATPSVSTALFITTGTGNTSSGRGRFPGGGGGLAAIGTASAPGAWYFGNTSVAGSTPTAASVCHESSTAGSTTFNPASQMWNTKSQW